MTGWVYLGCLLAASGCMLLLDWRYRLFWWRDARSAAIVTTVGFVALVVTDGIGIWQGVFLRGESEVATGVVLAPEFPLEEPVFLLFLILNTMVVFNLAQRLIAARSSQAAGVRAP